VARKGASPAAKLAARVNAQMGRDVVMLAHSGQFRLQRVPSGSLTIDRITGGGFGRGRHSELYGDESAGKSFILYRTMALAQARGEICALIDTEHIFEADWFAAVGGNPEDLIIEWPETAEEAIQTLMLFTQGDAEIRAAHVVGIDSVTSLLPLEEREKDVMEGDDRVASQARMMSRLLRRVTTLNQDTAFIWTNQWRDRIGPYGGGNVTTGGRALKFYASVRVEMRQAEKEKRKRKVVKRSKAVESLTTVGRWVQLRAEKNKTAAPYRESMFFFDAERRCIDREREIIHLGLEDGLIERHGNTFTYEDTDGETWRGTESVFCRHIRDNNELSEELEWAITENTRLSAMPDTDAEDEDDDGEG
jgi:recombination protein RecA